MTGLETLEKLFAFIEEEFYDCDVLEELRSYKNIIEKELKTFEVMKRVATELIYLDDGSFHNDGKYAVYDNEFYVSVYITKDEYDLLKEVLKRWQD